MCLGLKQDRFLQRASVFVRDRSCVKHYVFRTETRSFPERASFLVRDRSCVKHYVFRTETRSFPATRLFSCARQELYKTMCLGLN